MLNRLLGPQPLMILLVVLSAPMLGIPDVAVAKVFFCASGDVQCLISAIATANQHPGPDTIILQAGTYTFTVVDNTLDGGPVEFGGGNALPSITSRVTILGAGPSETVIESSGAGRLFHIAASGRLILHGLTIQNGDAVQVPGGAIFNRGTLTVSDAVLQNNTSAPSGPIAGGAIYSAGALKIVDSRVTGNSTGPGGDGGGIRSEGSLEILRSTIDNNFAEFGGGIFATGITTVKDSAISANDANSFGGGLYLALGVGGTATITSTTIASNTAFGGGGLLVVSGTARLTNVTTADNFAFAGSFFGAGGVAVRPEAGGTVLLQNTIVDRNLVGFGPPAPDCSGSVTSLGNNIIGSTAGCTIDIASTDFVGDAGLGVFVDDGTPGNAHIPLLAVSSAIDAANRTACPRRDQLGHQRADGDGDRRRFCDIGAVEFIPSQ